MGISGFIAYTLLGLFPTAVVIGIMYLIYRKSPKLPDDKTLSPPAQEAGKTTKEVPKKNFIFRYKWIILFFFVVFALPQIPGCVMANSPKKGRVVDKTTGQGMADVAVIATAEFSADNGFRFHGGGGGPRCTYKVVTFTDNNGDYSIPNQWLHMTFGIPLLQSESETTWTLTALKPRYAIVEDADDYLAMTDLGVQYNGPNSVGRSPPATWWGLFVSVAPIEMKPVESTLRKQVFYYVRLLSPGVCGTNTHSPNEIKIRKAIYDELLPLVCREDPDAKLNWEQMGRLGLFSPDESKFRQRMRELTPDAMNNHNAGDTPIFRAGDICQAMTVTGEPK